MSTIDYENGATFIRGMAIIASLATLLVVVLGVRQARRLRAETGDRSLLLALLAFQPRRKAALLPTEDEE